MSKHIELNDDFFSEIKEKLNSLGDETRLEIIMFFREKKEACVTEIAEQFKLSRPTISHHLNFMKRMKILNSRKDGKEIYYSFNKEYVVDFLESLIKLIKSCC